VHVELHVPGQTLVVRREHRAAERHVAPDAKSSIRDAFDAAKLKLQDYKRKQAHDVKAHPTPLPARVSELLAERDYGFIRTSEGARLYFHRNSVMNGLFDQLKLGDAVHFIEGSGDTGPTAAKVWRGNGKAAGGQTPRS